MRRRLLPLLLVLCSSTLTAAPVDLGDITRSGGLDWLDVTLTRGLSFDDVQTRIASGAAVAGTSFTFDAFRYATSDEVHALLLDFGVTMNTARNGAPAYDGPPEQEAIEDFIRTLGDTYDAWSDGLGQPFDVAASGAGYTYGLTGTAASGSVVLAALAYDVERSVRATGAPLDNLVDTASSRHGGFTRTARYDWLGSFLVRQTTAVPAPLGLWVMLAGLVVMLGRRCAVLAIGR